MTDHQTQPRQRSAWDALLRIISRPKWQGPGPEPSEDETMEMVVDEIKRMRQEDREGGRGEWRVFRSAA